MQDQTVTFDLRYLPREPSLGVKIYILFLLITLLIVVVRLTRIWLIVPPLKRNTRVDPRPYSQLLESSSKSLRRWISAVLLGYVFMFSIGVYEFCNRMIVDTRMGKLGILFAIQDYASALSSAIAVVLVAFAVWWHFQVRLEKLGARKSD
jgi:hypothetical protein